MSCLAALQIRSQELRSNRERTPFFSFALNEFEGLESEKGDRTQPSDFMVSALLSLSSYVLGPDMIALDVTSHSASDGESDIMLLCDEYRVRSECSGPRVVPCVDVCLHECMNTVTHHL